MDSAVSGTATGAVPATSGGTPGSPVTAGDPLLQVRDLSKRYAGLVALSEYTWTSPRAPSTASSAPTAPARRRCSTCSRGMVKPTTGTIAPRGPRDHQPAPGAGRPGRHRADVPEHPSVRGHVGPRQRAGRRASGTGRDRSGRSAAVDTAASVAASTGETGAARRACWTGRAGRPARQRPARSLPYGDQRRLEIARAVAARAPGPDAGRAERGHEPHRDRRPAGAHPAHPRTSWASPSSWSPTTSRS